MISSNGLKLKKELKNLKGNELLEKYVKIRSHSSLLFSLGTSKNKDYEEWKVIEDFLVKTKGVDFDNLDNYYKYNQLSKLTKEIPEDVKEILNRLELKILEVLH